MALFGQFEPFACEFHNEIAVNSVNSLFMLSCSIYLSFVLFLDCLTFEIELV